MANPPCGGMPWRNAWRYLVAPFCHEGLADAKTGRFGADAARIVELLEQAGPSMTDDLKAELVLDARRYQRARASLEKHGAVLSRHVTVEAGGSGHRHVSELRLWDRGAVGPSRSTEDRLMELLVAGVSAAVFLPQTDARRAFTWTIPEAVVERAVADDHVVRPTLQTLAVATLPAVGAESAL